MSKINYLNITNLVDSLPQSITEDHALSLLNDNDLQIYSVGVSTAGIAEMRMAHANMKRHVIATSIDTKGLKVANKYIDQEGLQDQVTTKLEDITKPLPYLDGSFDFVYARLVLHYLNKQDLVRSFAELHRILKVGGRLFVVVRSTESHDAKRAGSVTDPETKLTTYSFSNTATGEKQTFSRYFHSEESIRKYAQDSNFAVNYVRTIIEHIYVDFMRTQLASQPDILIELLATK